MGNSDLPVIMLTFVLMFGLALYLQDRHPSWKVPPFGMSQKTFNVVVAVTAVLLTSRMFAYSSYINRRVASMVTPTVDPPKQAPDLFAEPK